MVGLLTNIKTSKLNSIDIEIENKQALLHVVVYVVIYLILSSYNIYLIATYTTGSNSVGFIPCVILFLCMTICIIGVVIVMFSNREAFATIIKQIANIDKRLEDLNVVIDYKRFKKLSQMLLVGLLTINMIRLIFYAIILNFTFTQNMLIFIYSIIKTTLFHDATTLFYVTSRRFKLIQNGFLSIERSDVKIVKSKIYKFSDLHFQLCKTSNLLFENIQLPVFIITSALFVQSLVTLYLIYFVSVAEESLVVMVIKVVGMITVIGYDLVESGAFLKMISDTSYEV